jgi:tetratricopeptide (TPR) repeat protein/predicted Ser/Thr protein kinase
MTPDQWQEIDNLIMKVVEQPIAERAAFLDQVCSTDQTLRLEVESLISFREKAQSFLEVPAFEDAAHLFWDEQNDRMGKLVIGRYRIEGKLGAGGMGDVYLAEDTNLDIKVAIKFLSSYLEEDQLAKQRLIKEAKAAAKLDHPNICSVYEVKEEGNRSFIVMQYVAGKTLADRNKYGRMEINEALDVSIQVVEALAEAHLRGIVHRDIKPGNIMITERRQVKVLDFGLAKVVGPTGMKHRDEKQGSLLSLPGERAGTPPYMSPEQAKGTDVDARCDLFAVGVVLYECLTGERPFCGKTDNEILSEVIQFDPPPPSKLNSKVTPELDSIVLKALAKDAHARHQTAEELLADLRALQYKSWLSVLTGYLLSPRVYVPTCLMAVSVALLSYFIWTRLHMPYQPPPQALRQYVTGTTALRNGAYLEASKALQLAVAADDKFALAHARLAEAYTELDYTERAKDEVIRAQSLARQLPMQQLDELYLQAVTNTVLRDFPPAIECYQQIARQASDHEKADVYLDLGRAYEKNDELKKAKENYQQAIKLAPQEAAAFLRLGVVCGQLQDFTCATEAFQKAEGLYQALRNLEGVTEVLYERGFLFLNGDKLHEARAELEKALQMTKTTRNKYQQIRAMLTLSSVSVVEGHSTQALQQATQAIALARDNGMENQATSGLIWLGNSFLLRGEYSNAEKYYKQALELAQRDKLRLSEAWARVQLGSLRTLQHNTDEGLRYIEQALAFYQQGGYRKYLSQTAFLLGRAYRDKGDSEAALRVFKDQLHRGEQLGDLSQVGRTHEEIGSVLSNQGQYPEALHHYDASYGIYKSLNAEVYVGYAAMHRASVLWQTCHYEETRVALDEASVIATQPDGKYKQLLAAIHMINALMQLSEWHLKEAELKSRQALDLAGTQYKVTAVQAKYTLGLARARSGAVRAGKVLCQGAVEEARSVGNLQLLAGALLASAEAMLENVEPQPALETALEAQESFARFGQQDSEWRAWLIAARASQRLGKERTTREYASYAGARLSSLEQKWGPEAYNGYLARPDIQHFRKQLNRLLKP